MAELQLSPRSGSQRDCVYCRGPLGEAERWSCPRCAVALHADCAAELGHCPTTGCGEPIPRSRPAPEPFTVEGRGQAQAWGAPPEPLPRTPRGELALITACGLASLAFAGLRVSQGAHLCNASAFGFVLFCVSGLLAMMVKQAIFGSGRGGPAG